MRDVVFIPWEDSSFLVIASDNSGGIGEKEADVVSVPYEIVAYYTTRVALMECVSVGATPQAIVVQNLTSDEAYHSFLKGIDCIVEELGLSDLYITGSSESNMDVIQSGLGITVIGKVSRDKKRIQCTPTDAGFAVIGVPLVGENVLIDQDNVIPLPLFIALLKYSSVYEIVPVGSKGIRYEVEQLVGDNNIAYGEVESGIDLEASAGPATCVVISYDKKYEREVVEMCQGHFSVLSIR